MYSSSAVYVGGDRVYYHGCIFEAQWWTQGEGPVDGTTTVWKFISTADGRASEPYDSEKAYVAGDYVYYNGVVYEAQWWTMAEPGTAEDNGAMPWKVVIALVDDGGESGGPEEPEPDLTKVTPWESGKAYVGGDLVLYNNKVYSCGWWTTSTPGEADEYGEYVWTEILDVSQIDEYIPGNSYTGGMYAIYNGKLFKAQWWTVSVPGEADEYGEYVWLYLFDVDGSAPEESSEEESLEEESEEASEASTADVSEASTAEASSEGAGRTEETTAAAESSADNSKPVSTGDTNAILVLMLLIAGSAVCGTLAVYRKRKMN